MLLNQEVIDQLPYPAIVQLGANLLLLSGTF